MSYTASSGTYPVMVLAYNEQDYISKCLDSIFEADPGLKFEVFVMANGCTDRTEDIVLEYRKNNPSVHLVSIRLGDKCNAWNVFVHRTVPDRCPERDVYFFVDGDAQFKRGSFSAMVRALADEPTANAVGAPPASGRSMERDRKDILESRGLVANLYALKGTFVNRLIHGNVKIPLGFEGDDGLIASLVKWDLDPRRRMDSKFVARCPDAGFIFESMRLVRPSDWAAYWKRMVRYGRRHYEFLLIRDPLKAEGIEGMPSDIRELYQFGGRLRLAWSGLYTLTNWFALREIRRIGRAYSETKGNS